MKTKFALLAVSMGLAFGANAQTVMKLSTSTQGDALVEWLNVFAKGVNASTAGKVNAQVYPASQLGQIPRMVEGAMKDHSTATNPRPVGKEDFEALFRAAM